MPERDGHKNVLAARYRFFQLDQVPHGLIPNTILQSWLRCRAHGLTEHSVPVHKKINVSPAQERACNSLLQLCHPEIQHLQASAREGGSIALVTCPQGRIVNSLDSPDHANEAVLRSLAPFGSFCETDAGTNAVGTSIASRCAIDVLGPEHYLLAFKDLGCSAAPIFDVVGTVIGTLALVSSAERHHPYAMALIRKSVERIEHALFQETFRDANVLHLHPDQQIIGSTLEGLVAFDNGKLVGANSHAAGLLELAREDIGRRRYSSLLKSRPPDGGDHALIEAHNGLMLHVFCEREPSKRAVRSGIPASDNPGRATKPVFDSRLEKLVQRSVQLLDADIPVLIQGETGSGKEVLAREIHRRSRRSGKVFVAVNCAAIPESLIESELFGYVPGAFTGARREGMQGLMREADGGVLFLDEIGDMPLGLQTRLLRVLQEREVTPLGAHRPVRVDFLLISASHCDLAQMVANGGFRADLFYRAAQSIIVIPPLRERSDRAQLIRKLWTAIGGETPRVTLSPESVTELARHDWPGNVRQLVSTLRILMALSKADSIIGVDDLSMALMPSIPLSKIAVEQHPTIMATTIEDIQENAIRAALEQCGGNVSASARKLGVSRSTLHRRLARGAALNRKP